MKFIQLLRCIHRENMTKTLIDIFGWQVSSLSFYWEAFREYSFFKSWISCPGVIWIESKGIPYMVMAITRMHGHDWLGHTILPWQWITLRLSHLILTPRLLNHQPDATHLHHTRKMHCNHFPFRTIYHSSYFRDDYPTIRSILKCDKISYQDLLQLLTAFKLWWNIVC